jgi:hypothetical protein
MIDITPILQAIISLAAALITAFLLPWLKAKLTESELVKIQAWVDVAVSAAEGIYKAGNGEAKKDYVLDFLENKGFSVDENELDKLIEASVYNQLNSLKQK